VFEIWRFEICFGIWILWIWIFIYPGLLASMLEKKLQLTPFSPHFRNQELQPPVSLDTKEKGRYFYRPVLKGSSSWWKLQHRNVSYLY